MKDKDETKKQLINELNELHQRVAELEEADRESSHDEHDLWESEEKYRLLVENASEAIVVAQDGFLKFFNTKVIEFTGYREKS